MQEQPHNRISSDQGWAKMKPILDEAMPLNDRSRRYPFFWWLTSALVVIGLVGFTMFNNNSFFNNSFPVKEVETNGPAIRIQQNQEANLNSTIARQNDSAKSSREALLNGKNSNKEVIQKAPLQPFKTDVQKTSSGSKPSGTSRKKKVQPVPMAMIDPASDEDLTVPAVTQTSIAKSDAFDQDDKEDLNSTSLAEEMPTVPTRNGQVVEAIPVLNSLAFNGSVSTDVIISSGAITKTKRKPSFLEPNLEVSGLAGLHGGIGTYAGAGVNVNVNRRLSITTGIGYFSYHPDASLFAGSKELSVSADQNAILNYDPTHEGYSPYVNASSVNSAASYNVINPLIESVRQWQISGGLKWNMTSRFFADGGVHIGFNTMAISEYPIVLLNSSAPIAEAKIGNSLNSYHVIRSTMTSLYAGIGYRFGKHVDVFARWTHGLDTYLLNELDQDSGTRTDYIRGLTLGLRYTL